jgi:hypothetical protein
MLDWFAGEKRSSLFCHRKIYKNEKFYRSGQQIKSPFNRVEDSSDLPNKHFWHQCNKLECL